ncbi:MAG: type II secretion system F family protein [Asticcacaulis sp.]
MLTIVLIALLSFILLASLGYVLTGGGASEVAVKRAQAIGVGVTANPKRQKQNRTPEERRKQIMEQLKEAEKRERKERLTLRARMLHAGLVPNLTQFWIWSVVAGVVGLVIAFLISRNVFIGLGAAFALGYGLPRWILSFLAKGRVKKFTLLFPDAMDILVRGIKSGLPVNDGLKIISRELSAPLGPEFQRLVENVGIGMSLEQALDKMCERMPAPELRFFSIVIAIQSRTGGNLAEALNNLSTVLRARRMMREKIQALSGEALASAGIIGSLPPSVAALIFLTRPDYIMIMFTDIRGQMLLLAGGVWMLLGILSMRKMINFKF